jgi:hypothetical protein
MHIWMIGRIPGKLDCAHVVVNLILENTFLSWTVILFGWDHYCGSLCIFYFVSCQERLLDLGL